MISKTNLARFQGKVFLLGTIVIAVLILWSLFGDASGAFHLQQLSSLPAFPVDCFGCSGNVVGTAESLQFCPVFECAIQPPLQTQIPQSNIVELISTLLDIPFQALMTIAVLIVAVIIAIPIILILRRKSN